MAGCLRLIFAYAVDVLSKCLALRDVQPPTQGHEESGLTILRGNPYICGRYSKTFRQTTDRRALCDECTWIGAAGHTNQPQRFSLPCLGFSFLFRGVQRGYFSFQRERSEIMQANELLISAEELPWRNPISACRS
jgi:hypothetical protein